MEICNCEKEKKLNCEKIKSDFYIFFYPVVETSFCSILQKRVNCKLLLVIKEVQK